MDPVKIEVKNADSAAAVASQRAAGLKVVGTKGAAAVVTESEGSGYNTVAGPYLKLARCYQRRASNAGYARSYTARMRVSHDRRGGASSGASLLSNEVCGQ